MARSLFALHLVTPKPMPPDTVRRFDCCCGETPTATGIATPTFPTPINCSRFFHAFGASETRPSMFATRPPANMRGKSVYGEYELAPGSIHLLLTMLWNFSNTSRAGLLVQLNSRAM